MDIITTVRTCVVAGAVAATLTLSSCGDEATPPSQDIGVELPEPEVRHFEPACNTPAAATPCLEPDRPRSGTRNRMDFRDEYAPRRER